MVVLKNEMGIDETDGWEQKEQQFAGR